MSCFATIKNHSIAEATSDIYHNYNLHHIVCGQKVYVFFFKKDYL